jgi:L-rhamnonate dehydratase
MIPVSLAVLREAKSVEAKPLILPPTLPFQGERSKLKITSIRMVKTKPRKPVPSYTPAPGSWSTRGVEVANPMSIYPKYKAQRSLFMADDLGLEAVEIMTDKGVSGIGFGGPGCSFVIEKHLGKLLLGRTPSM